MLYLLHLVKQVGHFVQERMCEDSASVDLTAYDIACCIQDVNKCIEAKQKLKDGLPGASGDCKEL